MSKTSKWVVALVLTVLFIGTMVAIMTGQSNGVTRITTVLLPVWTMGSMVAIFNAMIA